MLKRAFCKFHKECYFSSEIRKKGREKAGILRGRSGIFSYCILLSESGEQLEILHSAFLRDKKYREHPPTVCGGARTKLGAIEVVKRMMDDAAAAGMPGDARSYLLMKEHGDKRTDGRSHTDNP